MILSDFILTYIHIAMWIALFLTNKDTLGALMVLILFSATVVYTSSPYYDRNIDAVNHGVQSIWFLSIFMRPVVDYIHRVSLRVKILLIAYAVLQFFAMIDAILYGEQGVMGMSETFFYNSFLYIQIFIDILILSALWTDRRSRGSGYRFTDTDTRDASYSDKTRYKRI